MLTGFKCQDQNVSDERIIMTEFDFGLEYNAKSLKEFLRETPITDDGTYIDHRGTKCRLKNGKIFSRHLPVIEHVEGYKEWRKFGYPHREDGPAKIWPTGQKEWYQTGVRHRDDGPAIEHPDGYMAWFVCNRRHRTDGPAVITPSGRVDWWVDDTLYFDLNEWAEAANFNINSDEFTMLKLQYG